MSKTDKTKPHHVRLREVGAEEYEYTYRGRTTFSVPSDFKWSYAEQGVGPKHARWAKRMKAKKNRRRDIPWRDARSRVRRREPEVSIDLWVQYGSITY